MSDWCSDISRDDVLAILARAPEECHKSVAAIERAIAEGSLVGCKKAAHRIKGMAGNLGASRLAEAARNIELHSNSINDVVGQLSTLNDTLRATLAAIRDAAHNR